MKLDFDVIIIGSGVAGMTAAIYLKRSGISCCILEREIPGGQINKSSKVENYPGFLEISGPDLSQKIYEQITNMKVPYKYGNVLQIINNNEYRIIKTDIEELTCKNIIIATGKKPRKLGIVGEDTFLGKGVSYCALCDANLYKDEEVVVIGGANAALEETLYLSDICKKVYLIHRRDTFTADKSLVEKVTSKDNVICIMNSNVISFNGEESLQSVTYHEFEEEKKLNIKGAFVFVGQIPSSEIFKDVVNFDKDGYIIVNEHKETNVTGIYAAGDIVKKDVYQLITAMNDGVIAATNCIKNIKNNT